MDSRPILLLAGLLATTAVVAQAYRWVDDDGVVHYSDRPQPGAEEIQLPKANTTTVRAYRPDKSEQDAQPTKAAPFNYKSLGITSPVAEETLWNIGGQLSVEVTLSPALQPGHQIRAYLDGERRTVSGLNFQLEEVWRGAHTLQAEVVDETGKLMIRSTPRRFYVQQNTVNF